MLKSTPQIELEIKRRKQLSSESPLQRSGNPGNTIREQASPSPCPYALSDVTVSSASFVEAFALPLEHLSS